MPTTSVLAVRGAGQRANLHLHQPLGGEADHLAQDIGVGRLFQKRAEAHHLIGYRWLLGCVVFATQT